MLFVSSGGGNGVCEFFGFMDGTSLNFCNPFMGNPQFIEGVRNLGRRRNPVTDIIDGLEITIEHFTFDGVFAKDAEAVGGTDHGHQVHVRIDVVKAGVDDHRKLQHIREGKELSSQGFHKFLLTLHTANIAQFIVTEADILTCLFTIQVLVAVF